MDLDEYRRTLRRLAQKRDGEPVFNGSIVHAAAVMEQLFASADKKVDVLSGNLNARVFGRTSVVEEARLFLGSSWNNKLRIILEEDSPLDRNVHPFFERCSHLPNIELRVAPEDLQGRYGFHVVLVDNDSYRYEPDKTNFAAVAAFGDHKRAENFARIYRYLWDQSKPVEINPRP